MQEEGVGSRPGSGARGGGVAGQEGSRPRPADAPGGAVTGAQHLRGAAAAAGWIAILQRRWGVSPAASTGVHTAEDVLKVLLAGADVAMVTSALLRHGPGHLSEVEARLGDWLGRHGRQSVDQVRGRLSQRSVPDPAAFARANYLTPRPPPSPGCSGRTWRRR